MLVAFVLPKFLPTSWQLWRCQLAHFAIIRYRPEWVFGGRCNKLTPLHHVCCRRFLAVFFFNRIFRIFRSGWGLQNEIYLWIFYLVFAFFFLFIFWHLPNYSCSGWVVVLPGMAWLVCILCNMEWVCFDGNVFFVLMENLVFRKFNLNFARTGGELRTYHDTKIKIKTNFKNKCGQLKCGILQNRNCKFILLQQSWKAKALEKQIFYFCWFLCRYDKKFNLDLNEMRKFSFQKQTIDFLVSNCAVIILKKFFALPKILLQTAN